MGVLDSLVPEGSGATILLGPQPVPELVLLVCLNAHASTPAHVNRDEAGNGH